MEFLGLLWNEVIIRPLTNSLLVLYVLLFSNLGLGIIAFTIVTKVLTYPLTMRQLRQTQRMQSMQPRMKELQEKYKGDPQKRGQEQMRLYKELGVNPVGCLGPFVIQMPIFIGLFWAVNGVLPVTPENLASLGTKLYGWLPFLDSVVPVNRQFLSMDLAVEPLRSRNVLAIIFVVLSGATMFVQQKMSQVPNADPTQRSQQQMQLFLLPIMFGGFSFLFPAGLVVYWVMSNVISIVMQYFVTGWGGLRPPRLAALGPTLQAAPPTKELGSHGAAEPGGDRQDRGGSNRERDAGARRRARRNRGRRH